jgi:acetate kinase
MIVLTVNAGSSSVRLGLFRGDTRLRGSRAEAGADPAEQLRRLLDGESGVARVAHRVVHGGAQRQTTCLLDDLVEREIERATSLAPLHNPATLAWVRLCRRLLPAATPFAVFDSGFFARLPEAASTYALPGALRARLGLRRLGFHGLAHRSMWECLRTLSPARTERVISFQLGSGCSAAALRGGQPIDTSMGFTPFEGLVMATRAGDLDPGVLLLLAREGLLDERLLGEESGLAGLSGTSGSVTALLADGSPAAELALEVYAYRARKYFGAYLAALGGCDAVLIGGGVGEHAAELRPRMLGGLEALGLVLDPAANAATRPPARISAPGSRIEVWVVPTDEESVLAREALSAAAVAADPPRP